MREKDLRELVKQVQAAGGPLSLIERGGYDEVGIDMGDEGGWAQHMEDAVNRPSVQAQIVGALKLDLLDRGHRIDLILGAPRQATLVYSAPAGEELHRGEGGSEMEALLHAWLGATHPGTA